ncbi:MAG: TylF/MycF/NovP-related O-methyltransferase, partial [Pirellula sp.]
ASLLLATEYIVNQKIPGDIVECGVWQGGSMMIVAQTLLMMGDTSRTLYLYDTFEGMSEPTVHDRDLGGVSAQSLLNQTQPGTGVWCFAGLDDVKKNIAMTGYPIEKIIFVKGKVEEQIPAVAPQSLALLRLDTDWYESTYHELVHLYPRLNRRGIMIIDDYGHWKGAKKAVDEYFAENHVTDYLSRVDYTGRILVKTT